MVTDTMMGSIKVE